MGAFQDVQMGRVAKDTAYSTNAQSLDDIRIGFDHNKGLSKRFQRGADQTSDSAEATDHHMISQLKPNISSTKIDPGGTRPYPAWRHSHQARIEEDGDQRCRQGCVVNSLVNESGRASDAHQDK